MEIQEILDKLWDYGMMCEDELGEACRGLHALYRRSDYMSDEFEKSMEREALRLVLEFQESTEIVEREEVVENKIKIRELIWNE